MTRKRILVSLASGVAMLVVSFILTNVAYSLWENWLDPGGGSMAAMGGVILGLVVAPICALVTAGLVLKWPDRRKES
jgi:hypothetical protein